MFQYRPSTAKPLTELAETLLREPNSLTRGERELIATTVSRGNECTFCANSHAAIAAAELGVDDVDAAPRSTKLTALLDIALQVRESGRAVTEKAIDAARAEGATDVEIHDTVLIAAAFCMFNRYVDGLGTAAPEHARSYLPIAKAITEHGYVAATRS
nr:carboxymuconolactone decarboxylase family protein [Kibdelosporangium sp. MJ126-NF4]